MTYQDDTAADDDTLAEAASKAPEVLMDGSLGLLPDSTRPPGLTLTKEQIKSIKRYEMAGLALPITLGDVIGYLGYNEGEGAGEYLEPREFLKSFEKINAHARTWNPLRTRLIGMTSKLEIFADEIANNGVTMSLIFNDVDALKKLPAYNIKTLADIRKLKDELGDRLKEFNLDAEDKSTVSQFSIFLNNILDAVRRQQSEAHDIKKDLGKFSEELAQKVLPEIKFKVRTINNSNLETLIKDLSTDIEQRADLIEKLNDAYKKTVKDALSAASTMNIAGLGIAIYNGINAEKIRSDLKKERDIQKNKIEEMRTKNKVLASLHRVRADLLDLDIIVVDADIATKNLESVWLNITNYLDASVEGVDRINDALGLYAFFHEFNSVINPWKRIGRDAVLLYEVFDQADKEFRDEYNSNFNMRARSPMPMNTPVYFDAPDTTIIRNSKDACNSTMIDAKVYHTATDYLPNVFAKFTGLNEGLNAAHTDLSASLQRIYVFLEIPLEEIDKFHKDIKEQDLDDEALEYISQRISKARDNAISKTGELTKILAGHLRSLRDTFNRQSTLRSLAELQTQATGLPLEIDGFVERKAVLSGELLALDNGIKALENKGLAEIGEETILNAEALAALQLGGPPAAALKVALDLLQKSLVVLEASLNYQGLLSLRTSLYTRIDAEQQKIRAKNDDLWRVGQHTKLIESFHHFDDERVLYAQEYSKIVNSLESFVNKHTSTPSDDDESVQQWIQDARAAMNYLPTLR
ncbi:alpha-xenorhabdolysin family binary toxin subunit A [Pseudomonas phytophila]|uniref:Alpha-xenorhabdolysin family binary toxin subunit A n=1 Tax=Pseudomonas phytophila TaxID=2867264 RepID=A0ABY6FCS2_9PSED|nr:alpha-xenorhabdolysin family binary toxin subunit A [Pseudomonas phytophila]UXZ95667.1 alpha-xenorhabdolysin family binary toxin subunit A [Pseudomonas phytophila]